MLEKNIVVDVISVDVSGVVSYREATQILEDGLVISESFHRTTISKGDDISSHPPKVQTICAAAWANES